MLLFFSLSYGLQLTNDLHICLTEVIAVLLSTALLISLLACLASIDVQEWCLGFFTSIPNEIRGECYIFQSAGNCIFLIRFELI